MNHVCHSEHREESKYTTLGSFAALRMTIPSESNPAIFVNFVVKK